MRITAIHPLAVLATVFVTAMLPVACGPAPPDGARVAGQFLQLVTGDADGRAAARRWIGAHWQPGFAPMVVETIPLVERGDDEVALWTLLRTRTGQHLPPQPDAWFRWWWAQDRPPAPGYAQFKAALYSLIDPRFKVYFAGRAGTARIRLDEVRWGGVRQDGIPPLRNPRMAAAKDARWLNDGDAVFGIEVNGDARAYPKRILAWHELFTDTVGGVPVTGVYCTLCEAMILYDSQAGGKVHEFGTSGFLFRSNKLMYDRATQSLWSTLWGKPVLGPLAPAGPQLRRKSVVTTTWGEWRKRHPDTRVLDINTGFTRDYSEGTAYSDYFADDRPMFAVPSDDHRLHNKDEVLALMPTDQSAAPLAIAASFLAHHPVYAERLDRREIVVLTDGSGANRVYEARGNRFLRWDGGRTVWDDRGRAWTVDEEALTSPDGARLPRMPAHRAFWFGWHAAFPNTRLVH